MPVQLAAQLAAVGLRCKIRSYLCPKFSANFTDFRQLGRARSRLYRSRFLQPNTHFAAFFEIFKIYKPVHLSIFKISNLLIFSNFCKISMNFRDFSQNSSLNSAEISYNLLFFDEIFKDFAGISQNVRNFDGLDVANFKIPELFEKIPKLCRNILQKLSR